MNARTVKRPAPEPLPEGKLGDRTAQNGVELEHNGLQWLPVLNAANYPRIFSQGNGPNPRLGDS